LQRDVKKKTAAYGVAAVLLAVLLTSVCYHLGVQPITQRFFSQLKTFTSYEELENFLKTSIEQARQLEQHYLFPLLRGAEVGTLSTETKAAPAHSTTNIQVAGVDEADIVKTDGEYLYVVSGGNVSIVKAYPPNQARVLSKIPLNGTGNAEVYFKGDKLAVLGNRYLFATREYWMPYFPYTGEAFVKVYNISDRANPVLARTVILNGTLSGSRLIDDYVYAVFKQQAIGPSSNETDIEVNLPKISINSVVREVEPTEIHYVNVTDVSYDFTTVVAVNIINDAQEPTYEPFLTGATACMYVSLSNMYLTVPNTNTWFPLEIIGGVREETLIYRIRLDGDKIVCEAEGNVSGYVLNQFSMDEHNGFFRIATTEWTRETSTNSLFILNMSLNIVGRLENIAPGERIYSARFMGDRCYLVTFRQIDPFFVIDVGSPTQPKVLGELKIPGFSGYLHPYDENHIIGVGKQDTNVKLSLFNVTDVTAPKEAVPSYILQGGWSDSTVLTDHKAFLSDKSKQLLVLPVSINWIEIIGGGYYYKGSWQGAYVFNITLSGGFVLRGNVTHRENDANQWDSGYWVKRALYIDDVLYTVSEKKIKANDLEDLAFIKEIGLI